MDQPLTYNPSLAGSFNLSNVYISFANFKYQNRPSALVGLILFPTEITEPHLDDYRDGHYIAYMRSDSIRLKMKISYGLEFQQYRLQDYFINPTSISTFINFHYTLVSKGASRLSASAGLKYNRIYRRIIPNNLEDIPIFLNGSNGYSFQEALDLFSNTGRQVTYSSSIQYHLMDKLFLSAGISYMKMQHPVLQGFKSSDTDPQGLVPLLIDREIGFGLMHINFSLLLNQFLAIDLNVLDGYSSNIGGGLSFRLGNHALYRINFSRSVVDLDSRLNTLAINVQVKRCNINLSLTGRNGKSFRDTVKHIVQLGAGYTFGGDDSTSLMRLE